MTHFATDVLIQWQNKVSCDTVCHLFSFIFHLNFGCLSVTHQAKKSLTAHARHCEREPLNQKPRFIFTNTIERY
jgi:hypothetical protein